MPIGFLSGDSALWTVVKKRKAFIRGPLDIPSGINVREEHLFTKN
jgi:hypothetical protein